MKNDLYNRLICALTHDLETCEKCKGCPGKNCAEIRTNLIRELAKSENKELPWIEEGEK